MNGCNVDICWEYVKDNLSQVQQEIEDCKGMDGWDHQCQVREAAVVFLAILKSLSVFFCVCVGGGEGAFTYFEEAVSVFFLFMLVNPEGQLWNRLW